MHEPVYTMSAIDKAMEKGTIGAYYDAYKIFREAFFGVIGAHVPESEVLAQWIEYLKNARTEAIDERKMEHRPPSSAQMDYVTRLVLEKAERVEKVLAKALFDLIEPGECSKLIDALKQDKWPPDPVKPKEAASPAKAGDPKPAAAAPPAGAPAPAGVSK
jgi:hypothetical protein